MCLCVVVSISVCLRCFVGVRGCVLLLWFGSCSCFGLVVNVVMCCCVCFVCCVLCVLFMLLRCCFVRVLFVGVVVGLACPPSCCLLFYVRLRVSCFCLLLIADLWLFVRLFVVVFVVFVVLLLLLLVSCVIYLLLLFIVSLV